MGFLKFGLNATVNTGETPLTAEAICFSLGLEKTFLELHSGVLSGEMTGVFDWLYFGTEAGVFRQFPATTARDSKCSGGYGASTGLNFTRLPHSGYHAALNIVLWYTRTHNGPQAMDINLFLRLCCNRPTGAPMVHSRCCASSRRGHFDRRKPERLPLGADQPEGKI